MFTPFYLTPQCPTTFFILESPLTPVVLAPSKVAINVPARCLLIVSGTSVIAANLPRFETGTFVQQCRISPTLDTPKIPARAPRGPETRSTTSQFFHVRSFSLPAVAGCDHIFLSATKFGSAQKIVWGELPQIIPRVCGPWLNSRQKVLLVASYLCSAEVWTC